MRPTPILVIPHPPWLPPTSTTQGAVQHARVLGHQVAGFAGLGLLRGWRCSGRQVVEDPFVVVVDSHRQHFLGILLANHIAVQVFVNLEEERIRNNLVRVSI